MLKNARSVLMESADRTVALHARGATGDAHHDALGVRFHSLPFTAETILEAIPALPSNAKDGRGA